MENLEKFFSFIIKHNSRFYNCCVEDIGWTIAESKISGKGVIATKCFQPGDVIFIDYPMVVGPRSAPNLPLSCIVCYNVKNLKPCSRNCFLPVCSLQCENDDRHIFECFYMARLRSGNENDTRQLLRSITPVRCLKLDQRSREIIEDYLYKIDGPKHGLEVVLLQESTRGKIPKDDEKFMYTCCRVLDANAFEIPLVNNEKTKGVSLRGLFPMASTMNHSCTPNTTHTFGNDHQMIIRASKTISEGDEITTTYVTLLLGTLGRRCFLAKSKHFNCQCSRCQDPTELDTYLSALNCRNTSCEDGILIPSSPLNFHSEWICRACESTLSADKVALVQKIVAQELSKLDSTNPKELISYIQNYRIVADTNHTKVQLKYLLVGIVGHAEGYKWSDVSEEMLLYKRKFCEEILIVVRKLGLGECEIRKFCSCELVKTKEELERRSQIVL